MKLVGSLVLCAALGAPVLFAQRWEVGGGAGAGFYTSNDVTNPTGSASAKIQTNLG